MQDKETLLAIGEVDSVFIRFSHNVCIPQAYLKSKHVRMLVVGLSLLQPLLDGLAYLPQNTV
jgi:hypothetical protein